MKMTYDDQYLITVSEDASVMLWRVQDKEGRGLKRDKEIGWAEEILITKCELEEKVTICVGCTISKCLTVAVVFIVCVAANCCSTCGRKK